METRVISEDGIIRISATRNDLRRQVIALLRMVSFVKENKWARENGLIERYKALPSLSDFALQNHSKVSANIIRALIEKEARTAGVDFTKFEIKKQRNSTNFQIVFNTNYFDRINHTSLHNLRQVIDTRALLSYDTWSMREYQTCIFNILGSRLGMNRIQPEIDATLNSLAGDLAAVFSVFAQIYPAPVEAPEVATNPIPLVETA